MNIDIKKMMDCLLDELAEAAAEEVTVGTSCWFEGKESQPFVVILVAAGYISAQQDGGDMVITLPAKQFVEAFSPMPRYDNIFFNEVIGDIIEDAEALPLSANSRDCVAAAVWRTVEAFESGVL